MARTHDLVKHRGLHREAWSRPILAEHSLVCLSSTLELSDGRSLAAGSVGAVVGIWADGAAYEIEFAEPFHAVVTVAEGAIEQASGARGRQP